MSDDYSFDRDDNDHDRPDHARQDRDRDRDDLDRPNLHRHDFDPHDSKKTKKTPKWVGVILAVVGGLSVVGALAGEDLPGCDSSAARGMISDLFVQVPANTDKLTVAELKDIDETSYDEATKTRTCRAQLLDSAGTEHAVAWTARQESDSIYYTLEVKS